MYKPFSAHMPHKNRLAGSTGPGAAVVLIQ